MSMSIKVCLNANSVSRRLILVAVCLCVFVSVQSVQDKKPVGRRSTLSFKTAGREAGTSRWPQPVIVSCSHHKVPPAFQDSVVTSKKHGGKNAALRLLFHKRAPMCPYSLHNIRKPECECLCVSNVKHNRS